MTFSWPVAAVIIVLILVAAVPLLQLLLGLVWLVIAFLIFCWEGAAYLFRKK